MIITIHGDSAGSNKKRLGECHRCGGSGRLRRIGARTIHPSAVSLADKARTRKGGK